MILLGWKKRLTACALVGGVLAGIMHVVNRLVYRISTMDNLLDDKEEKYYDWRFGRIYYRKQGKGSPILLIHDLNVASSAYEWHKVVDELSLTNTVYSLDLLGCGRSDKPNLTYTNFFFVQLITDFIKHIIAHKVDVIASGESGSFVLMACANDNSIINKVTLINPQNLVSLSKIPTKRTKIMRHIISTPVLGTFIYNICINKRGLERSFQAQYFYDKNKIHKQTVLSYFESSHLDNTRSKYLYASMKSRFTNTNILNCLKRLDNSLFIIVGSSNPENILTASQYQNHVPSIEIIGIDKTNHLPHMEMPMDFIEQVKILFEIE